MEKLEGPRLRRQLNRTRVERFRNGRHSSRFGPETGNLEASAARYKGVSLIVSRSLGSRLSALREPASGTEIASSTSMEIRYVNPRFLPAFILMPPHSMLIVDERLRTGRRSGNGERRHLEAPPSRRSTSLYPSPLLPFLLLPSLPFSSRLLLFLLSSNHRVHVRNRRVTVIWRYYPPSLYIGEPIVR